ncbi:hypothetical protein [Desulfonatronum thiodismutans]|uniref:hypothetical protein n=1 Tax=Desulfonatronum thiodismutans TaxID=159290 RepID=UPI0004ABDEFF|nr:hypothetical protein [Desulfonatronum thiodismutans]
MQATDTNGKVFKQVNLDVEQGKEWARQDYIDISRAFDAIKWMSESKADEYFEKFQALDGLCGMFDRLFFHYCHMFDLDLTVEDAKATGKQGWKECSQLHELLAEVHVERDGMKGRKIWRKMLRATGAYIATFSREEIDRLSLEDRFDDRHEELIF